MITEPPEPGGFIAYCFQVADHYLMKYGVRGFESVLSWPFEPNEEPVRAPEEQELPAA